ncbi:MAG TPA: phage tail tape measure protein [Pseudomonas sp.]|uniref:phage tail tape measure protein n=1 Tax=Pseudomonas sp. TaxID=306 RepID=UPI002CA0565D|nr:phage tail tape measure protein [Pseudomonas sp.]HWH86359.1 phage tail tape measure protein [Pseudomonas sp.]
MSANKRNLNVALNLTANTKGLVKGLDDAEKGLGDVEKGVKGLGKTGKTSLVPLADGVAKVGKETERLGKTSKTALTPLTESLKKTTKATDALGKTSKTALTPMPDTLNKITKASDRAGASLEKTARRGANAWERMGRVAKNELNALSKFKDSTYGQLGGLGVGFGAGASVVKSAQLDKGVTQLQLTTGGTKLEASGLRKTLLATQVQTGQSVDRLKQASDALAAGGLSMAQIEGTMAPLGKTMAVSTTDPAQLAKAASVGSTFFGIDLTKAEQVELMFDKMTVAGREGFAELENLPDIFARVGIGAKSAGMSFDQTLAFVETLSKFEPNSERLSTLADSTLRLFTNADYLYKAEVGSGVKFYNKDGSRRDPMAVIAEMRGTYSQLKTDKQRATFIERVAGEDDLDTQKGLRMLLTEGSLEKFNEIEAKLAKSQGTIQRDFEVATDNAVDQLGRLSGALRTTTDMLSGPVNDAFTDLVKKALAPKSEGGYGLTGGDIMGGAAAGAAGLYVASRLGSAAVKKAVGSLGGLTKGVTVGKVLEESVGVTPVFVVNMPEGLGGGVGGVLGDAGDKVLKGGKTRKYAQSLLSLSPLAARFGPKGWAVAAIVGAIGGLGLLLANKFDNDDPDNTDAWVRQVLAGKRPVPGVPGSAVAQIGAPWSNSGDFGDRVAEAVKRSVTNEQKQPFLPVPLPPQEVSGAITIKVDNGVGKVTSLESSGPVVLKSAYTGRAMGY